MVLLKTLLCNFIRISTRSARVSHTCKYSGSLSKTLSIRHTFGHKTGILMSSHVTSTESPKLCYTSTEAKVLRQNDTFEDDDRKAFETIFPIIVDDFTKFFSSRKLHYVSNHFTEALKYNVPHGKKNRGMAVISSYKLLVNDISSEQLHIAGIVGWCLEIIQACFLISDDIMDQSITRRGQPCWYRKEHIGMMAINDTIMMNAGIYKLLSNYIKDRECVANLHDCFQDVIWLTSTGQCLDMLSAQAVRPLDLEKYTIELYSTIIQYKTAYYTICLSVRLALVLAEMKESYTSSVEDLLLHIGHFFQVQDDYLDCFGDPNITGKIGTDIEDGKCCWPIVMALSRVNSEDRKILEDNYGMPEAACSQKVRDVYQRIGLKDLYAQYEKDTYKKLCQQIEDVSRSNNIPSEVFFSILNKIYKRNK